MPTPVTPPRRRTLLALAPLPWLAWGGRPALAARPAATARHPLMGTEVGIVVADGAQPGVAEATALAFAEMTRLARQMSRHDPASALSRLNQAAGGAEVTLPAELLAVLATAQHLHERTGGAFDARVGRLTWGAGGTPDGAVPDVGTVNAARADLARAGGLQLRPGRARLERTGLQIDLGGVAKLPILAAGLRVMSGLGVRGVLIDGGGDVLASARPDGQPWRVGLRDPLAPHRLLGVLPLREGVVASSGDYERFVWHGGRRYHHVLDPRTGRPTGGVPGVTLVARAGAGEIVDAVDRVNGLGTAAMVAGPRRGPELLQDLGVRQALLVAADGRRWLAPALARELQASRGSS